jgi:hypothetical protein
MQPLVILANLGRVRVLRIVSVAGSPNAQTHLAEGEEGTLELGKESIGETVTDQAGRFARGSRIGRETGMSRGEEHNLEAELERRALQRVAQAIGTAVEEEGNPPWRLVAPQQVLAQLQAALPPECRKSLAHAEPGDLTKLPLAELEARFLQ